MSQPPSGSKPKATSSEAAPTSSVATDGSTPAAEPDAGTTEVDGAAPSRTDGPSDGGVAPSPTVTTTSQPTASAEATATAQDRKNDREGLASGTEPVAPWVIGAVAIAIILGVILHLVRRARLARQDQH